MGGKRLLISFFTFEVSGVVVEMDRTNFEMHRLFHQKTITAVTDF
jgi:hypothetical protein